MPNKTRADVSRKSLAGSAVKEISGNFKPQKLIRTTLKNFGIFQKQI